ncbi:hypothetical protein PMPD1_2191 [Paramixta manurensis]|uniref:DUF2946 domain-containing protein n=1 Tax=Paramixta manurensis TaxID=2740817 RepID=A0A6M8U8N3_9GAMM|nr:hypothetical protein PMPD1_2191 [Erwiniaceae bacterium PD-1]
MKSSRLTQQSFTAWLAIAAVLLLFVAPVISKTLAQQQPDAMSSMTMVNMPMMHTMPSTDSMHGVHHAAMDHSMPGDDGFACGYCELLVHVPLMVWIFIPFIWLILRISHAPPVPAVVGNEVRRNDSFHHPRAPPLAFSA